MRHPPCDRTDSDGLLAFLFREKMPAPVAWCLAMILLILLLGLVVGVLVGLLGIGGGVVLVPALVYLLRYDQHLAQGTSLLILLPPVGLGALRVYWKNGTVDKLAGLLCAFGILVGAYGGSLISIATPSRHLKGFFGCFLVLAAFLLWRKSQPLSPQQSLSQSESPRSGSVARSFGIFLAATVCGIASGLFGIGGGVLLVPLLVLFFGFSQHRAQGTSLIALIPPTGILAFIAYARADFVSWKTGLLLIPGVFLGGIAGGIIARHIQPRPMRLIFAGAMLALGFWQAFSAWV